MVVNAGCRDKDLAHLNTHLAEAKAAGKDVAMRVYDDRSLLAFQGPAAAAIMQALVKRDLASFSFRCGGSGLGGGLGEGGGGGLAHAAQPD